jgi:hypothetical protein
MYLPSTTHMQYLKDSAMVPLKKLLTDALDPKIQGDMMDASNVEDLRERGDEMMSENDPQELANIMRAIVSMYQYYVDPDGGDRTRFMMGSMAHLYYVYCLAFTDVCCTMMGYPSVINSKMTALGQINELVRISLTDGSKHPVLNHKRLSFWLNKSCIDWMDSLDYINELTVQSNSLKDVIRTMIE